MSKQSSAPSSERSRPACARASRSRRRRSKSTRCSQSTAHRPVAADPHRSPLQLRPQSSRAARATRSGRRHGLVLERRRERHRHVQRAEPAHRRVEVVEGALGDHRRELGGRRRSCGGPRRRRSPGPSSRPSATSVSSSSGEIVRGSIDLGRDPRRRPAARPPRAHAHHRARADERHVVARALDVADPERERVLAVAAPRP